MKLKLTINLDLPDEFEEFTDSELRTAVYEEFMHTQITDLSEWTLEWL